MKKARVLTAFFTIIALLAILCPVAGAWTYSIRQVEYVGSSDIIGTKNGKTYSFRVGVITNDSAQAMPLELKFNYLENFIGQFWYSIDDGASWIEVPKGAPSATVPDVAPGASVQVRAVINYYRYLSTSPWGEADHSIGDDYYFAFAPGGRYYQPGTTNVDKTGFVIVTNVPSSGAWTYSIRQVEYVGSFDIIGTKNGKTYSFRVGVITNASSDAMPLELKFNYLENFIGQFWYSIDDGASWIEVPKGAPSATVPDVAPGASVQVRAVINYYRYLSTSPWGEADHSIGDDYYFAFAPGGRYYEPGTTNVDKTGFVIVVASSEPTDDLDNDGQTVSQGDCNDNDPSIYTGAPEICGDGIDQDCDGADLACTVQTVTSAGGLTWMTKNLGAFRAASSMTDEWAFGDYYQWGRGADGHEKKDSNVTSILSSDDNPGHGDFITTDTAPFDWRTPQNDNLWQGEAGVNNPCPPGFRLPTATEFSIERASWSSSNPDAYPFELAFASPLKLVGAGARFTNGSLQPGNHWGNYWTSTVDGTEARIFEFDAAWAGIRSEYRSQGSSVRCIQDYSDQDMDGDGQSANDGDCNDLDASIYAGAPEVCEDGIDQDCDGADAVCPDADGDGQTVAQGDCNDEDSTIYRGAPEICGDSIDQDCDGWDRPCGLPEGAVLSAGQIWLDRNLGASRVALSANDTEAYGDLYQWGRLADGHEKRTSSIINDRSRNDVPGHGDFIATSISPFDWRYARNNDLWQGVDGINNPCPSGYRLPTATELEIERLSWETRNAAGAFNSPARFVKAGYRDPRTGEIMYTGSVMQYWSSTVAGTYAEYLYASENNSGIYDYGRAEGNSVRCIMDSNPELDIDQDGQTVNDGDCDDLDVTVYAGAPEVCEDGIDQDCDGLDAPCTDNDGDGQAVSQGDCNDSDNSIYTGAPEICGDGIDQDCDGEDEPCPVTVTSAGQVWMDRNLGASRQATSYDDPQAFGDLYQWGRLKDGHEKRTSETTSTRSNLDVPGHGDFITVAYPYSDWREPENDSLWQGESGINNPCPSGFRLPTATELQVERASWHPQNSAGAYASPAKFVVGGYRDAETGDVEVAGREGYYWSSTVTDRRFGKRADYLVIRPGNTEMSYVNNQATGQSVRCIQD